MKRTTNVLSPTGSTFFFVMYFLELFHGNSTTAGGYSGTGSGTETISKSVSGSSPSSSTL